MQKYNYFPLSLIALAIISGCSSVPQNQSLAEAHSNYNNARTNPEISNLAQVELQDASDTLNKADNALNNDEEPGTVDHLAYLAQQKVRIAQETAKRKTAEMAVTNAGANRNEVRLEARTAEADTAKAQLAELVALNAQKTDRGMVITLGDILFSTDKAQLKPDGIRNVQKLGDFLARYPQNKVSVEGHTDSVGSNNYNQGLSDRRAYSVRSALTEMGISNDRVATRGYGEEFPVASNNNAEGRQLNRRVEIVLSDANGNITPR